jgi:hypothetical protein
MRSALPYLLAAVLGVAAAALVACGSSGSSRRQFIPDRSAERLRSALDDVRSAVDAGDCTAAARAAIRAKGIVVNLPSAVNDRLVARLDQGVDNLRDVAARECQKQQTQTQPTTTPTTPENTTPTTPTDTTTTPTTTTTTTGTGTTTTPTTGTGTTTTGTGTGTGTGTTPATPPPAGDTTGGATTP